MKIHSRIISEPGAAIEMKAISYEMPKWWQERERIQAEHDRELARIDAEGRAAFRRGFLRGWVLAHIVLFPAWAAMFAYYGMPEWSYPCLGGWVMAIYIRLRLWNYL